MGSTFEEPDVGSAMSDDAPRSTLRRGRGKGLRGQGGFHNPTEFMMPVVIVVIVLAIAVPSLVRAWPRNARAEVTHHLVAIASAEAEYFSRHGMYLPLPSTPPGQPKIFRRRWPDEHAFAEIGWVPEGGSSYCSYAVAATDEAVTVEADCDSDGDGEFATFGYVHAAPGTDEGITGPSGRCRGDGIYHGARSTVKLNTPGPCTMESGRSVF